MNFKIPDLPEVQLADSNFFKAHLTLDLETNALIHALMDFLVEEKYPDDNDQALNKRNAFYNQLNKNIADYFEHAKTEIFARFGK